MHESVAASANSASSSSQSVERLVMTSAGPFTGRSMSSIDSSASLPRYDQAVESEEEYKGDDVLDDMKEDDEDLDDDGERPGTGSRGSPNDQKEGLHKRKPRITLARGGACVVCR